MMNSAPATIADLRPGERAVIDSFTDGEISAKLLEMGCLPGETVEMKNIAPLGDPVAISVSGYLLGLRRSEAAAVRIRLIR